MKYSSLRDVAIAGFFLTVSGLLIAGATLVRPTLDHILETQQARMLVASQTLSTVRNAIEVLKTEYQSSMKMERDRLQKLTEQTESGAAFMEEIAVVVGVRMLEDNSVLPPSTADEMAREAIQEITKSHSERIGKLLEAINDKFLRERR